MSVLTFDKSKLGNLEYSLRREMLGTDRRGGYMSTTIVGCNTRKYHGLIVAPIDDSDRTFVLLSSLDETILHDGEAFNLALHRFPGVYEPRGHKYITDFEYTPTPTITYQVGGLVLRKELLWIHDRTQLMIRYTLQESPAPIRMRLRPFFAFRDKHALTQANMEADGRSWPVPGGVKSRLYADFPWLYLQTDADTEFVPAPDWYYDFEYAREIERGYAGREDLLTTGYFELTLRPGAAVIFSASVEQMASPSEIGRCFAEALAARSDKVDFRSCLRHSARQFVVRRPGGRTEVLAGYPWHGQIGRQTLLALPGITLEQGRTQECLEVLDTLANERRDGMFRGSFSAAEAVDAPLWFFWTLQQLEHTVGAERIWARYGDVMRELPETYLRGAAEGISVHENGLIWAEAPGRAITWMDAAREGAPVVRRDGYQVETNALWYNAICYTLRLAGRFGDKEFVHRWEQWPARIRESFERLFWIEEQECLADFVGREGPCPFIRPAMAVAVGLDYKMLDERRQAAVLRTLQQHLLTPVGLRSLSPRNPRYKSRCEGDPATRAEASMNGAVWVWPLWFYVKGEFDLNGADFLPRAEKLLDNFGEQIQSYGIGSINEVFDGDPPHAPRGAISSAWSVGAVLMIQELVERWGAGPAAEPAESKETNKEKRL